MLSIFATPEEAREFSKLHGVGIPRRPLQQKTLERIARGLVKFVINAKRPFIVRCAHGDHANGKSRWGNTDHSIDAPLPTVTSSKDYAVVDARIAPFTAGVGGRAGQSPPTSADAPLPTVTAKADRVVAAATLQTLNHAGDHHRGQSPDEPLHTVTSTRDARALVAALVTKHYGGHETPGSSVADPIDSITAKDHNAVTVAYLNKHRGESPGTAADAPMDTITAGPGGCAAGAPHALGVTCAYLSHLYGTNNGSRGDVNDPMATVTGSSNHAALVSAFLATYYTEGSGKTGQPIDHPSPTVTGKDRIQLVTVVIDGQTFIITDIAMRMLRPRELARAQGFDDSYIIDRTSDGRAISKADQVKLIGNSVCPQVARAIVKANVVDLGVLDADPAREAVSA